MATGTLLVFRNYSSDLTYAQTAALTTLVFFQLFNLFNSRSAIRSIFQLVWKKSQLLLTVFSLAVLLQLIAVYYRPISTLLGLRSLDLPTLSLCLAVALSIVLVDELRKLGLAMMKSWIMSGV